MGYRKKSLIVKKTIEKSNYKKYSDTHHPVSCYCNICKGSLVDPQTKKAHTKQRTTRTRSINDKK